MKKDFWKNLIHSLSRFKTILVTGPQRSGTRIASKILANDLNYLFIDEQNIRIDSIKRLISYGEDDFNKVIQCPGLSSVIHLLADEETAVVMMKRPIEDIVASQERIGWAYEDYEKLKYSSKKDKTISEIKYDAWESQKLFMNESFEIDFDSLSFHEMWIDKKERSKFNHNQTMVAV